MATGHLTIDLGAIVQNFRALDALSAADVETAAVVKADGYGLGAERVANALAQAGARSFFVATCEEAVKLRKALGPAPNILCFSGHMNGDTALIHQANIVPMLNSIDQMTRHFEALPGVPFGIQLDSGMNRLGLEAPEWASVGGIALEQNPVLLISHLACADEPEHPQNQAQLKSFHAMTDGVGVPRSLAATGGTLMGPAFHFDVCRPGIGLYGGLPFEGAAQVVQLDIPIIQTRHVHPGESVGYGASWVAQRPTLVATISAGYADGLIRAMGNGGINIMSGERICPVIGRISMDLITVDITDLNVMPDHLTLMSSAQGPDAVAQAAGTIGYEILTSLGARYSRAYI